MLIKPETNNLFHVVSIVLNYSINMTMKSCATFNNEALEYLYLHLKVIDVEVEGFISDLFPKPYIV